MAKSSGSTRGKMPSSNPQMKGAGNITKQTDHDKNHVWGIDKVDERQVYIMQMTGVDESTAARYDEAIQAFTGVKYKKIRRAYREMRERFKSEEEYLKYKKYSDLIEDFISKSPKWHGGVTFRGVNSDKSTWDKVGYGEVVNMRGMASWSTNINFASGFNNGEVVYRCSKPQNGTSVNAISKHAGEMEVLTSGRCRYKVVNKEIVYSQFQRKNFYFIDVEPIANAKK